VSLGFNALPHPTQDQRRLWRSQDFYRQRKHVADAAFRPDELRLARIAFELAAQPQDLNVHAAVEHLFIVHAAGGKQLFAAQHLLGRAQERGQQVELASRQCHGKLQSAT
jgi:hypothetical protein